VINLQSAADLPLAKVAPEALALGKTEARDDAPLDMFASLASGLAGILAASGKGETQTCLARRLPISPTAFRVFFELP